MSYQNKTGTLSQGAHPGSYNGQDAYNDLLITEREREREMGVCNGEVGQLQADKESFNNECETVQVGDGHNREPIYRARRLTPTECARLQGFPPDWCADVPHSDSAEYKLWGNGIGLPCIIPMMDAMGKEIRKEETDAEVH